MYRSIAPRLFATIALAAVLAAPVAAASPATYTSTLLMEAAPIPGTYGMAFDADDVLYVGSAGGRVTVLDKETGDIIKVYGPQWCNWPSPDGSLYNTAILNGTVQAPCTRSSTRRPSWVSTPSPSPMTVGSSWASH